MKKIIKYLAVVILAMAVFAGCKKDNYIVGGKLENTVTPLSTYDYLKSN
ncbi:MAG: Fasciclin protein, partial [Mucilaginibacter sp.]|nr:Fasciclin protein [Mucilaginibacter sp.]